MAKESYYFSHDYSARNDPKLQKVLMKLGHAGKGVFWDIIEMLYEEGGTLDIDKITDYAFALRADIDCINSLINDFDLFVNDGKIFWSKSVLERLNRRNEKSKKASLSAKSRWENANASNINANASKNDAIKERKGKENKENKGKEKESYTLPVFNDLFSFFKNKNVWSAEKCKKEAESFLKRFEGVTDMVNWQKNAETWFQLGIEFENKKIQNNSMPDYWDPKYYATLAGKDLSNYFVHLNSLGYKPVKDRNQNLIEFAR